MTIVEFLTARLSEDALAATYGRVFSDAYDDEPSDDGDGWAAHVDGVYTDEHSRHVVGNAATTEVADFIARNDPARVRAGIEAQRAILALEPHDGSEYDLWIEVIIRLVSVYSDHPDFNQAWVSPQVSTPRG